jgi:hypothetical protein
MGSVAEMSDRLRKRIDRDYDEGTAAELHRRLADVPEGLPLGERQDPERMQAAAVLGHDGSWTSLERRLLTLRRDWRDALMAAGLAQPDWPARLDAELGPADPSPAQGPPTSP